MWKKGTSFVHQIRNQRVNAMKAILKSNLTEKRNWRIALGILGGLFLTVNLHAQLPPGIAKKLSPVLKEEVEFLSYHPHYDYPMRVIVQVQPDFFTRTRRESSRAGRPLENTLSLVRGFTAQLTSSQIRLLLRSQLVQYVTIDAAIRAAHQPGDAERGTPFDFLAPIGADQAHEMGYDGGSGLGIAVFDSGITHHRDLDGRVEAVVDFTGGSAAEFEKDEGSDPYGHGTAVAGVIGALGREDKIWDGVAPGVKFIDVRVINQGGWGLTSHLIQAIDWVIANREQYDIRVANMSLGHPTLESYQNDPLCQAVERMVDAGIVTVVSAGNLGRTDQHSKIWGGITSPGTDPAVITVSAINTRGTPTHSDDIATSYGSRGPAYSSGLFKPDLSAPGNRIPSLRAEGGSIAINHPDLVLDENYMLLSGSSMATAVVSGTVALMLNKNQDLNPNLVKTLLMLTATKLKEPHMLEQGNGMVNALTMPYA